MNIEKGSEQRDREFPVIENGDIGSLEEASRWEAEQGKEWIDYPAYKVTGEAGEVTYVGVNHLSERESPDARAMFENIERRFQDATPDVVFVEGLNGLRYDREGEIEFLRSHSFDDVIKERGENGFTAKLALENNAEVVLAEPNDSELIEHLSTRFTRDEIFGYYFYLMLPQYQRMRSEGTITESFEEYINPTLEKVKEVTNWEGFDYSVEHASDIGRDILGKELDIEDEAFYENKTWPLILDSPEEETVLNKVSREWNAFRDVSVVNQMGEALKDHDRLFIVYGGTHSLVQKPAIEKLLGAKAVELDRSE